MYNGVIPVSIFCIKYHIMLYYIHRAVYTAESPYTTYIPATDVLKNWRKITAESKKKYGGYMSDIFEGVLHP